MPFVSISAPALEHGLQRSLFEMARLVAGAFSTYHQAELTGTQHLPAGPALLVGNHGLYGYETPVFFYKLHEATGRAPIGLADHGFFRIPVIRNVLPWLGGIPGTRERARNALAEGALVVCYPGGATEVFKHRHQRYLLQWGRKVGFTRVAAEAGVPIVPFAARGIDEAFVTWGARTWTSRLLGTQRYAAPVALGLGPLPLPTRFRFTLGAPLQPPSVNAPDSAFLRCRDEVATRVRSMLDGLRHG